MTSTTDGRIESSFTRSERLRREYNVPTGFQRAPFFEVQTEGFALIAIDTGVLRKIDPQQERWLEGRAAACRGQDHDGDRRAIPFMPAATTSPSAIANSGG